jgi:8-oxo-dGTP diphosphatase
MSIAADSIDWSNWTPKDKATLLFVIKDGQILLIEKKRGLGAGKINGPGGRVDPGETYEQCAVREVQEELCITATGVELAGELYFQFVDGYSIYAHVFKASGYEGTPTETPEAKPRWTPLGEIPYEKMWQDDIHWLPAMIEGRSFVGKFVFEGDTMLWKDVQIEGRGSNESSSK